jgi:phosphoglycerate dehydrogenase-like enzyme
MMAKSKDTTVLFIWKSELRLQAYLRKGLKGMRGVRLIFPKKDDETVFLRHAPAADIIVGWRPTEKLLESAEKLKLYINPGVGVQHLTGMFKKINRKQRVVLVNGHGNTYFVAQHAVAMLLALVNRVVLHHNDMSDGRWYLGDGKPFRSTPLRGRSMVGTCRAIGGK